jgi:ABC-type multidrug transport system ATPase subunit
MWRFLEVAVFITVFAIVGFMANNCGKEGTAGAETNDSSEDVTSATNISFGVEAGNLFTLLGPNGAGKTSVLEVLAGIEPRTDGVAIFEGEHMEKYNNKSLSFCLQKNYLWEHLTFREHLEIVGRWRGLASSDLKHLIKDLDMALQLDKNLDIKANLLSGGNKRKLNTVLALMAAPHIYILDEPTAGMDPMSRR